MSWRSSPARSGFGLWASALKLAADVARPGGAEPRERVRLALTVLLTALSGGPLISASGFPGGPDDLVADAIDNLGFGADYAVPAERPGVPEPGPRPGSDERGGARRAGTSTGTGQDGHGVRADPGVPRITYRPVATLAAFSLVYSKVISSAGPMLPLCLPFAVAARRQYGPGWDDHIAGLARQAEAVASLLRALPRKLHRLVRADSTPARYSPRQLNAFQTAYSSWAEQHPDLAPLLRNTDET